MKYIIKPILAIIIIASSNDAKSSYEVHKDFLRSTVSLTQEKGIAKFEQKRK